MSLFLQNGQDKTRKRQSGILLVGTFGIKSCFLVAICFWHFGGFGQRYVFHCLYLGVDTIFAILALYQELVQVSRFHFPVDLRCFQQHLVTISSFYM